MKPRQNIYVGQRFEKLVVLGYAGTRSTHRRYKVKCDCGTEFETYGFHLKQGNTTSCGCTSGKTRRPIERKEHGHSNSPTYSSWCNAKSRCYNPNDKEYANYGERGIVMADAWKENFEQFLADMGERPDGMTLDRIDYNKGYEPGNCRWVNSHIQTSNRRTPNLKKLQKIFS